MHWCMWVCAGACGCADKCVGLGLLGYNWVCTGVHGCVPVSASECDEDWRLEPLH